MLVALSGGPDSTALLLAAVEAGHRVTAAHYDHALRADSAADARHVAALCDRLAIPLIIERRTSALAKGSLQAAAREARYAFLHRARVQTGAAAIATAHTLDDNLETILINLIRGTGLAGLAGIPETRGPIVRPLLKVSRAEVLSYLDARGVTWLSDPANQDPRFLRVAVRHHLLPALERANPDLRQQLEKLSRAASAATNRLDRELPTAAREDLQRAPRYARARALASLYASATPDGPPLRRRHLQALDGLIEGWRAGAGHDLPGHIRLTLTPDRVVVAARERSHPPLDSTHAHQIESWPCSGCSAPEAVHLRPGRLELGYRRPGLRLRPPNARGSRKLQDVLVDAKVPAGERDRLPLVFREGQLAWIPGVAVDVAHAIDRSKPGLHVEVRSDRGDASAGR